MALLIRGQVSNPVDAAAAASGQPGFADAYAHAFTDVIALVAAAVAVTAAAIMSLSRTARSDVSPANAVMATTAQGGPR